MNERIYTRDARIQDIGQVTGLYREHAANRGVELESISLSGDRLSRMIEEPGNTRLAVAVGENETILGTSMLTSYCLSLVSGKGGVVDQLIVGREHGRNNRRTVANLLLADLSL